MPLLGILSTLPCCFSFLPLFSFPPLIFPPSYTHFFKAPLQIDSLVSLVFPWNQDTHWVLAVGSSVLEPLLSINKKNEK